MDKIEIANWANYFSQAEQVMMHESVNGMGKPCSVLKSQVLLRGVFFHSPLRVLC
jgi:hypothetical protein